MSAWRWIDQRLLVLLHDESLAQHSSAAGLRDPGLLDCAMARAQNLAASGQPDVSALAAAYASGLAQNHPSLTATSGWPFCPSACSWV